MILGAVLQYFGNVIANNKLKKELLAELNALINKQKTARTTTDEQKRISDLQAQIELLNRK